MSQVFLRVRVARQGECQTRRVTWQPRLLRWYRKNRRDLPWRRTKDPYKIWVSEIMLQQTTVGTVIPYYERFLKRFPTVQALAATDEEEVLRYWSGLGYYSRARNLWKAAKIVCRTGLTSPTGATFKTATQWRSLPGIGRYTAGAIASIAFDERAPILDGNVIRVLSRLFAIRKNPKTTQGNKFFWQKAGEILPQKDCGDFNQSLMELGATVCLPENPLCNRCPLSRGCLARREGDPAKYPRGKRKVSYQKIRMSAALIQRDGKLLMIRRDNKGLLKGMWEFPMVEGDGDLLAKKIPVVFEKRLLPVRHSVLNRRLTITPYLCRPEGNPATRGQAGYLLVGNWFRPEEIKGLPTSSMNRKILERMALPSPL